MPRLTSGFSAAELAAAEWSRKQREEEKKNRKRRSGRTSKRHRSRSRSSRSGRFSHPDGRSKTRYRNSDENAERDRRHEQDRSISTRDVRTRGDDSRIRSTLSCHTDKACLDQRSVKVENPGEIPRDPRNPLLAAYEPLGQRGTQRRHCDEYPPDRNGRKLRSELMDDEKGKGGFESKTEKEESDWDHNAFIDRSPSPNRIRSDGHMWDTRTGSWRSRAGGVYLPPDKEDEDSAAVKQPARYVDPIDKNRCRYFTAIESERDQSPSPQERPSPVYE